MALQNPMTNTSKKNPPESFSPLVLAYLGDSVFDLLVRNHLLLEGNRPVNQLHKDAKTFVCACAQAKFYAVLEQHATMEELAVLRRGRNAKSNSHAKNQTIFDYRHATGLEALFGYLYLQGQIERMNELFALCVKQKNK